MQDLDNDLDGVNHQSEVEVDDNIKSEPNGEIKSHNSSFIEEVKNSPTKSLADEDYLQTKNGPVRASILPVSSSQVPISKVKQYSQDKSIKNMQTTMQSSTLFSSALLQVNSVLA